MEGEGKEVGEGEGGGKGRIDRSLLALEATLIRWGLGGGLVHI